MEVTHPRLHEWKIYKHNALGFFQKRNDPKMDDSVWFEGTVFECKACPHGHLRFQPKQGEMPPVEVVEVSAGTCA